VPASKWEVPATPDAVAVPGAVTARDKWRCAGSRAGVTPTLVRGIEAPPSAPDPLRGLRGIGVIAAALVLALAASGCGGAERARTHSCGATDKRFITTASTNMTALGIWAAGYRSGDIEPQQIVEQARDAAKRVGYVKPTDPSLREAQQLIVPMFTEYGEAVRLYAKGRDSGDRMYRAYGLANFARDVLLDAQPDLAARGCDVGALL
jgi:hypothetical protein